ncbi:MAG: hypothetical protein LAT54_02435 [Cryomorphaceae bacterium]|nr:hypothetical protein [Cryomorphaceae bacterium]
MASNCFLKNVFLFLLLISLILGCDQDDSDGKGSSFSTNMSVGHSANDLLSDKKFSKLVVEIAFMPGVALRQGTINETKTFLEERLNKPNGIDIVTNEIPSGGKSQYSAEDIRDIEKKKELYFQTTTPYPYGYVL